MARRDSNIDPFNAGEPILPWQDPESEIHDADKEHKAYEAPHHGDSTSEPPFDQDPGSLSSDAGSPKAPRARRRSTDSLKREAARRARAQKADGKAAGPVARRFFKLILGIWLLFFLLSIGSSVVSCTAELFTPSVPDDPFDVPAHDDAPAFEEDDGSPEAQCLQLASTRMEHLMLPESPEHAAVAERIATAFAQRVETDFDRTPDELGIDPSIVAEWVISSLIYESSDVYAFPQSDNPYASAYFDVESCSMMTMYYEFQSDLYDYLREQGLYLLDIKQGQTLADTQQTDIAGILQAAMVETESRESSMCVRLTLQDGAWTIDEANFERYCDYVFGMPA